MDKMCKSWNWNLECLVSVGSIIAVSLGFEPPSSPKMNEERSSSPEQRPVIETWFLWQAEIREIRYKPSQQGWQPVANSNHMWCLVQKSNESDKWCEASAQGTALELVIPYPILAVALKMPESTPWVVMSSGIPCSLKRYIGTRTILGHKETLPTSPSMCHVMNGSLELLSEWK